jgi:hypothetical protein
MDGKRIGRSEAQGMTDEVTREKIRGAVLTGGLGQELPS